MKKIYVGISIGGTKSTVNFAELKDGNFVNLVKNEFPTSKYDDKKEMEEIYSYIDKADGDIQAISVICCSPLNIKKGLVATPPNLPGFKNTPIVKLLKNRYKVPVILNNDADANGLAEFTFGPYRGVNNFIYVTYGTGLGIGIILDGRLYKGNGNAGELGHVRIANTGPFGYNKKGSVEGFVSGANIPAQCTKLFNKFPNTSLKQFNPLTTKNVFEEARKGDELAVKVVKNVAKRLGHTIAIILDIFNPEVVSIGGIYARCIDLLEEGMRKTCKKECLKLNYKQCKIVPSTLSEKIDEYSSLAPILYL